MSQPLDGPVVVVDEQDGAVDLATDSAPAPDTEPAAQAEEVPDHAPQATEKSTSLEEAIAQLVESETPAQETPAQKTKRLIKLYSAWRLTGLALGLQATNCEV